MEGALPDAWANPSPPRPPAAVGEGTVLELPKSRALSRLIYHATERTLTVEFRSGAIYRFYGVLQADFDQLAAAPSPGARFNQHIQPYHEWERIA